MTKGQNDKKTKRQKDEKIKKDKRQKRQKDKKDRKDKKTKPQNDKKDKKYRNAKRQRTKREFNIVTSGQFHTLVFKHLFCLGAFKSRCFC